MHSLLVIFPIQLHPVKKSNYRFCIPRSHGPAIVTMLERGAEEHREEREMEEEEEDVGDDNNPGDDNLDDAGDEDDREDGLGGHAKMVAFHAAIKAVLNRQLEKMGQEVDNLSKHETLTI